MDYSVSSLLEKNFSFRSFDEKLSIVRNGKPTPDVTNLQQVCSQASRTTTRTFSPSKFEEISWLTGCNERNKLFCWPCLLFNTQTIIWNKQSFSNLSHLSVAIKRHEISKNHLEAFCAIKAFGRQRIDTALNDQLLAETSYHNQKVAANREVLKSLISATCFLAKQEISNI